MTASEELWLETPNEKGLNWSKQQNTAAAQNWGNFKYPETVHN